jgi:hypothetical protein
MRQKDLLQKITEEKEMIKRQMEYNERIINSRMAHLANEKLQIERRINGAATTI